MTTSPLIRPDDVTRWMAAANGDPERATTAAVEELAARAADGDDYARHVLEHAILAGVTGIVEEVMAEGQPTGDEPKPDGAGPRLWLHECSVKVKQPCALCGDECRASEAGVDVYLAGSCSDLVCVPCAEREAPELLAEAVASWRAADAAVRAIWGGTL